MYPRGVMILQRSVSWLDSFYSQRWRNSSQRSSWDDGISMVDLPCLEVEQPRKQIVKVFAEHLPEKHS